MIGTICAVFMSIKSHIFLDNSAKKQGNKQKTVLSTVGHENYLALNKKKGLHFVY